MVLDSAPPPSGSRSSTSAILPVSSYKWTFLDQDHSCVMERQVISPLMLGMHGFVISKSDKECHEGDLHRFVAVGPFNRDELTSDSVIMQLTAASIGVNMTCIIPLCVS